MSPAFLFPGQASQKIGMGADLYLKTELGKHHFDRANEIMGYNLRDIIFNGPEEELKQTRNTQPAIYIVSVIIGQLLLEGGVIPTAAAGHSLGEYSALTIAGAFDYETGLTLVKLRAESMQQAGEMNPGTMAAIIGLDDNLVTQLCSENYDGGIVVAANYNAPGQVVISGETRAVHEAMNRSKDRGARKAIELNVSGAFHSPLMAPAREALAEKLNSIEIRDTNLPVYSNVTAEPITNSEEIRTALIQQLENPVRWHETITRMRGNGISEFLEVGPGKVLQGLNRRIDRRLTIKGVENLKDLQEFEHV